ncbi:MAG: methyltransferase domain-containing protein [Desulfosalsimonas sp.]
MREKTQKQNRKPGRSGSWTDFLRRTAALLSGLGSGKRESAIYPQTAGGSATTVIGPDRKWCRFGVRDPVLLSHPDGTLVKQGEWLTVYFNGRDKSILKGGRTRVGRAEITSALTKVKTSPDPVFGDGDYTALGSVLKVGKDKYWMYYSHGTDMGFRRAVSENGIRWQAEKPALLSPGQFGCTRIGLPYVIKSGPEWIMVFEGIRGKGFRIFAAVSHDGAKWTPALDGEPIYTPAVNEWDGGGQANPALFPLSCEKNVADPFVLLYNGHGPGNPTGWDLGVLGSENPLGPWRKGAGPVLTRKELGLSDGRLEGARLVQAPESDGRAGLFFFGLPGKDSYKDGRIYTAKVGLGDILNMNKTEDKIQNPLSGEVKANDKLAQKYFHIWETYPIQKFTNELEGRWLKKMIHPGQSVLLAGSGGGRELEAILDRAGKIVAMDISSEMLRVGQEKFPDRDIEWRLGDVHDPPEDMEEFDHIAALGGVFAYLNDPFLAARALADRLAPGGMLTLCVMNSEHPTEKPGVKEMGNGRVRRTYSAQEARGLLEQAGLVPETVRGFRFVVDNLPPEWNKNAAEDAEKDNILRQALELENSLLELMPPEKGKFIWISGRKQKAGE